MILTPRTNLTVIILVAVLLRLSVACIWAMPCLRHRRNIVLCLRRALATGHGYSFDRGWYPFTPSRHAYGPLVRSSTRHS
jgi:hypothetical protein